MCNPVLAAGLAAQAGGSYLNGREQQAGQRRTMDAQNNAVEDEIARQHGYQADAGQAFADTLTGYQPGAQQGSLSAAQQTRGSTLRAAATAPSSGTVAPGSAPTMVKSEVGRKSDQAVAAARTGATNLGNLGGWDDVRFDNALDINRGAQRIGAIGDAAGGSSRLLPIDLKSATANSYRAPKPYGDLLQLGGQAASMYGMYGDTPSFGDLFSTGAAPGMARFNGVF